MHFAARWCAKEALVKCDPAFKGQPFSTMEVVRNESGEVSLAHHANGTFEKAAARSQHFAHGDDGSSGSSEETEVRIVAWCKEYWVRGWMKLAGRGPFGRFATRLATWFAPPLYKRNRLADLNPKGYIAPERRNRSFEAQIGSQPTSASASRSSKVPTAAALKSAIASVCIGTLLVHTGQERNDINRAARLRAAGVPICSLRRFHSNRIRCAYRIELRLLSLQSRLRSRDVDCRPTADKPRRHSLGRRRQSRCSA